MVPLTGWIPEARDQGFGEMPSEGDQAMKTTRGMLWLVLSGILMFGLITKPDLWAAPGQSPARQTVPTRTPEQPPTPEPTQNAHNRASPPGEGWAAGIARIQGTASRKGDTATTYQRRNHFA
jgi:hypothetical protein